jgi:hypothetical protein
MNRSVVDPYIYFDPDDLLQRQSVAKEKRSCTTENPDNNLTWISYSSAQVYMQQTQNSKNEYVPYNGKENIRLRFRANKQLPLSRDGFYVYTLDTWVINRSKPPPESHNPTLRRAKHTTQEVEDLICPSVIPFANSNFYLVFSSPMPNGLNYHLNYSHIDMKKATTLNILNDLGKCSKIELDE